MILRLLKFCSKTIWVAGKKNNNNPVYSVVTLFVKCDSAGRIEEERTVIFETNRDLEHTSLILPLSTFN